MNLWIDIANQELRDVMTKVDILILNDAEVKMLAGDDNLIRAAESVLEMKQGGILVVKRGEHGVLSHASRRNYLDAILSNSSSNRPNWLW